MSEPSPPKFSSDYGILDVTKGRKKLEKHIAKHGLVPVIIHANIRDAYGSDDGTSIEFNMSVLSVEIVEDQP